jgi:hypothetical protein
VRLVPVLVPPARGRRSLQGQWRSFAVLVTTLHPRRFDRDAFGGSDVRGRIEARPGALLLVYGEDRAPMTGELLSHCADLYAVHPTGVLRPVVSFTTLSGERWEPAIIDAARRERRRQREGQRRQAAERVPLMRPPPSPGDWKAAAMRPKVDGRRPSRPRRHRGEG